MGTDLDVILYQHAGDWQAAPVEEVEAAKLVGYVSGPETVRIVRNPSGRTGHVMVKTWRALAEVARQENATKGEGNG